MSEEAQAVLAAARKLSPEEQLLIADALYHDQRHDLVSLDDSEHAARSEFAAGLERGGKDTDHGGRWEVLEDEE
jgi:hypothetical protein